MRVSEQLDHHGVEPNPLPAAAGTLHALALPRLLLPRRSRPAERGFVPKAASAIAIWSGASASRRAPSTKASIGSARTSCRNSRALRHHGFSLETSVSEVVIL